MADKETPKDKSAVKLKPGAPAKPKLASVKPSPKMVKVAVPKAAAVASGPTPVTAPAPVPGSGDDPDLVKKGALLDQIVATTGVKRADAKLVTEALFAAMSEHLRAEKPMQIPPLGKMKVVKSKPVGKGATALTVRIRTPNTEQS